MKFVSNQDSSLDMFSIVRVGILHYIRGLLFFINYVTKTESRERYLSHKMITFSSPFVKAYFI